MPENKKSKKDPFESEGFLKGISHVESRGGKYMWNNTSTATGLYGQLYSEMDNNFLNTNGINSREDFAADTAIQSAYMRQVISGNMRDTPRKTNLYKDARDLTEEYMPQLGDKWNYRYDEIAALSHFLGRGGTRKYLGHHIRDSNPAGYKIPANNKTPVEYLELYNEGRNNYNQSIRQEDTTLPGRESINIPQFEGGGQLGDPITNPTSAPMKGTIMPIEQQRPLTDQEQEYINKAKINTKTNKRQATSDWFNDFGTTALTLGSQFRRPDQDEIQRNRDGWGERGQSLSEAGTWFGIDALTGHAAGKIIPKIAPIGKKIISKTKAIGKNINNTYNPKALLRQSDKAIDLAKEYDNILNNLSWERIDHTYKNSDVIDAYHKARSKREALNTKPIRNTDKTYRESLKKSSILNRPKNPGADVLEFDQVDFLHGAFNPHKELSAGHAFTGEGIQAYGPGLYVSDNPGVHSYYMKPYGFKGTAKSGGKDPVRLLDQDVFDVSKLPKDTKIKLKKALKPHIGEISDEGLTYKKLQGLFNNPDDLVDILRNNLNISGTRYPADVYAPSAANKYNYTLFDDNKLNVTDKNFNPEIAERYLRRYAKPFDEAVTKAKKPHDEFKNTLKKIDKRRDISATKREDLKKKAQELSDKSWVMDNRIDNTKRIGKMVGGASAGVYGLAKALPQPKSSPAYRYKERKEEEYNRILDEIENKWKRPIPIGGEDLMSNSQDNTQDMKQKKNGGQLPQKSAGGILSSTASGAATGMAAGPWGAVVGGAVGLGMGLIGHSQEQKALVDEDAAIAQSERDQYKIGRTQQLFTEANQNSNFGNPVMREYGGFIDYNKGQSHEGPNKGIPVDAQGNPGETEDTAALVEKGEITVMMPDGKPYVFPKKMAAEVKREMNRYKIRLGKDLDGDDKLSRAGYDSAMVALKDKNEATKPPEPEYAGDVAMAEYGGDDFFDGATVYAERPMQMEPWMSEPFNSNNKYGNQLSSIANQGISYPNQNATAGSNSQGTSTPATWTESERWQQLPMWGPDMDGAQPQQPWMTGKMGPVTGTPGRASMGVQGNTPGRGSIAPLQNNIGSFTGISPGQQLGMTPYGQYADNNNTNTPITQSVVQPELAGAYPTTATTNQTPMDTASAYPQGAVDVGANTDYSLQGTGNLGASNTTAPQSPDVYNPATGQMIASGISGAVGAAANLGLAFGRRKPTMMNAPQISAQTIDLGEQRLANRSRASLAKAESRNLARKVGATKAQDIATSALAGAAIERNLGEQNAAITMQEKQYNAQARQQAAGYNAQSKSQANQFNAMTQNRFNQDTNQYIGAAASNVTGSIADMNSASQGAKYLSMVGARSGYQQVRDPKTGKIVLAPIPGFYDKYNS